MKAQIKFGTSGWRAIMADEFTVENVRRAVIGIARYVSSSKPSGARVIVGRDPRFLGETFVALSANILAEHGITPMVISDPAPTPGIAYEVIRAKTDGAINFTASHNPAEYNGVKFSGSDGAPALPEVTKQIEAAVIVADSDTAPPTAAKAERVEISIKKEYLKRLKELVDLPAITKSGMKVAFDPLFGASRGYTDVLLRESGVEVTTVHDTRDVLFGGHPPAPDGEYLGDLTAAMKRSGSRIGIACDGDADRFGIVDEDGNFISPNYIIALLFDYIVESRGWKNGVAKSVVTTNMINALAAQHNIELHETPVGFKYIGELIKQDKIAIGGEESAGLSIRGHVPEKDGLIAGLLCCEMVAKRGYSVTQQLKRLFNQVGSFYPVRENFHLTPEVKAKFTAKLAADPHELDGRAVTEVVRKDGLKLVFKDGSWVCFRLSGTEPVVRVYSEARSEGDIAKLSAAAKKWIEFIEMYRQLAGWVHNSRRLLATAAVGVLGLMLGFHIAFGQNGMISYMHKREESRKLQQQITDLQQENARVSKEIEALKTDPKTIEREAREQLRYARPGEVIYTLPAASSANVPVQAQK